MFGHQRDRHVLALPCPTRRSADVGVAGEQGAAGRLFQPADMLADGGVLQAEAATGCGEAAGLGGGHEAAQQDGIEHRASRLLLRFMITVRLVTAVYNGPVRRTISPRDRKSTRLNSST